MKNRLAEPSGTLNKQQQEAVNQIDGPVMVIAGPGTGKTHVLAARVANILQKTDTPPYSILALTFTESAAINMRERVVSMIGKAGYYVNISTFHAFCADVIRSNPEYFPIDRGSEPLNELERYQLFESLIKSNKLEKLKPLNRPMFYMSDIISAISHLKREGVTAKTFEKIVKIEPDLDEEAEKTGKKPTKAELLKIATNAVKNKELAIIYKAYEQSLRERFRYDFDDMVAFVVEAFKNNELLLREYQEKLHYFLVDEYQDTNSAQNAVISLLASYWGDKANLFVVGDPHQSIYRFQGASIENTLSFIDAYPDAQIITLEKGYRCSQIVYDVAHELIQNNTLTQEIKGPHLFNTRLENNAGNKGSEIVLGELPSQIMEHMFIAKKVGELIASGIKPEDIAVLYRNNAEAEEIQETLESYEIPYEIDGGGNILQNESIQQLLQYLRLVNNIKQSKESENIFEVMLYEWTAVQPGIAMKLGRVAGKKQISVFELVKKGYDYFMEHYDMKDISPIDFHQAESFIESLEKSAIRDVLVVFTTWFEETLKESGYMSWLDKQPNKIQLLTNLNSLYREIKSLVNQSHEMHLQQIIEAIDIMKEHRVSILAEDLNIKKGTVHLSTVHRAKGREWDYVFLVGFIDGRWGNARKYDLIPLPSLLKKTDLSKKERNEDERRLFYVALTRAKEHVYITYPQTIIAEGRSRDVMGSMFLEELPKDKISVETGEEIAKSSSDELERLLSPRKSPEILVGEKDFFENIVKNFKLSVTALNTYLRDQDEFVHNVLLRVPRAKPAPMSFGTAVHYGLEQFYKQISENKKPELKILLNAFQESLEKEPLMKDEFDRRSEYGKAVLTQYFENYKDQQVSPLFIEKFFGFGFSKAILDDIPLVGRIDRVDWIDQKSRTVRVVDYKTGRSKSVNEIEGKTKSIGLSEREMQLPDSIKGPYKRQLLFYKLLSDLDQTFVPNVIEGVFDFVEPDKQTGKFTQRIFEIKAEDVNDLKELIKGVMKEVRSLSFLSSKS